MGFFLDMDRYHICSRMAVDYSRRNMAERYINGFGGGRGILPYCPSLLGRMNEREGRSLSLLRVPCSPVHPTAAVVHNTPKSKRLCQAAGRRRPRPGFAVEHKLVLLRHRFLTSKRIFEFVRVEVCFQVRVKVGFLLLVVLL